MVGWIELLLRRCRPARQFVEHQWIGILVGLATGLIISTSYFWPTLNKLHSLGSPVGTYEIHKGALVTISQSELSIRFEDEVLRRARRKDADSVFVFPSFSFLRKPWSRDSERYDRFTVGHRLSIDGQYFYFTVELVELEVTSKDTVAYFDVFRKEYSEHNKGNP